MLARTERIIVDHEGTFSSDVLDLVAINLSGGVSQVRVSMRSHQVLLPQALHRVELVRSVLPHETNFAKACANVSLRQSTQNGAPPLPMILMVSKFLLLILRRRSRMSRLSQAYTGSYNCERAKIYSDSIWKVAAIFIFFSASVISRSWSLRCAISVLD